MHVWREADFYRVSLVVIFRVDLGWGVYVSDPLQIRVQGVEIRFFVSDYERILEFAQFLWSHQNLILKTQIFRFLELIFGGNGACLFFQLFLLASIFLTSIFFRLLNLVQILKP